MRTLSLPTLPSIYQFVTALFQHNTNRLLQYDALRGFALTMMLLDHTEALHLHAEYNLRQTFEYLGPVDFLVGLATNTATPTFWLLAGVSIALFTQSRRRRDTPEWHITRFLLIRGAVLVALNYIFMGRADYRFDILASLGVSLALMSVIRLLPLYAITLLMTAILLSYQIFISLTWSTLINQEAPYLINIWVYSTSEAPTSPDVMFPVLGWLPLMGFGFVLGHYVNTERLKQGRTWVAMGVGLLVMWFIIRMMGGYGNFFPYNFSSEWYYLLAMSKGPPSLVYLVFNVGLTCLLMAILMAYPVLLDRFPLYYLIVYGQVPLFFFVTHAPLLRRLDSYVFAEVLLTQVPLLSELDSYIFARPIPIPEQVVRGLGIWIAAFLILLVASAVYRYIRLQYPKSILRFF